MTRTFTSHTIVFIATKRDCRRVAAVLKALGVNVGELHGDLKQMQRIETLARFKKREVDVLCSTDLAARGLDIEGVMTVSHFFQFLGSVVTNSKCWFFNK